MKRHIYAKLLAWKHSDIRKPLILKGARQVGKTFILEAFGRNEYDQVISLNFEQNKRLSSLFQTDLDPTLILEGIHLLTGKDPLLPNSLIIFDEIQQCPNAITALKYFYEQASDIHLIAAGSLLGVKLSQAIHFPVGKVNFLDLYPMTFFEFLEALDLSHLTEHLKSKTTLEPLPDFLHQTLIEWLKKYFIMGGMPEVVKTYVETKHIDQALLVQQEILKSYTHDFSKYADPGEIMKIMEIWDKIPAQLARENKKFMFSAIKHSARARDYEAALQWLLNAGLILKASHLSVPKLPLASYADMSIFKIFMCDTGLLSCLSEVEPAIILDAHLLFQEFKGALIENFVAQELTATLNKKLHYWGSESTAEVDFIFTIAAQIYPLEVKAGTTKHKKSLLSYAAKYHPSLILRSSPMNFYQDGHFCNIPLYAIGILEHLLI
ncbi:MAG TPA: ATP-binding protein [Gammaproteobacteria bacterium]|nr:ATP-binding protein [Gammaproteobacteria bacterium]